MAEHLPRVISNTKAIVDYVSHIVVNGYTGVYQITFVS